MSAPNWGAEAACYGSDSDMFFGDDSKGKTQYPFLIQVKAICKSCPVLDQCGEWAIKHEASGIWGGLTPNERIQIRRQRNIVLDDPMYWAAR